MRLRSSFFQFASVFGGATSGVRRLRLFTTILGSEERCLISPAVFKLATPEKTGTTTNATVASLTTQSILIELEEEVT
jgi:hypothetical protein